MGCLGNAYPIYCFNSTMKLKLRETSAQQKQDSRLDFQELSGGLYESVMANPRAFSDTNILLWHMYHSFTTSAIKPAIIYF